VSVGHVREDGQESHTLSVDDLSVVDSDDVLLVVANSMNIDEALLKAFAEKAPEGKVLVAGMSSESNDLADRYDVTAMHSDMLDGMRSIFDRLGKEFLPAKTLKAMKSRNQDRRDREDRRRTDLIQRMRMGFWFTFARLTGYGKFDLIPIRVSSMSKVMESLCEEVRNYCYINDMGNKVNHKDALENAVQAVWDELRLEESVRAVIVIESIAEYLHTNYSVSIAERRYRNDRRE
jgi:hypothetical protein